MNRLHRSFASSLGQGGLALMLLAAASAASAAETVISDMPMSGTTSAYVKPNIMLLMDTSGSMGWGHMPDNLDEIGGLSGKGAKFVGYKSAQCNALYYNPNTTYELPKKPEGDGIARFPAPNFRTAPYAGYVQYYASPDATDSSSVDLQAAFKAYDDKTLRDTGTNDTPQQAYYYVYNGDPAAKLNYAAAPCTDPDTGAPNTSGTILKANGTPNPNWTRKLVSATSGIGSNVDERQNFANWYSFYRTRMSLLKSAASLAFTTLNDSYRVGFINMHPRAITRDNSGGFDSSKYLAINDFGPTQRNAWFTKLFSQMPGGTSPAREGLARVGRYYAGKSDGINAGMRTGPADDPVQYSCQQNFTIMTTDGYWNGQAETAGAGPVGLDGTTKVGQMDGDISNEWSPRPIWDGAVSSTRRTTELWNTYRDMACPTTVKLLSTFQQLSTKTQLLETTGQTQQRTEQYTLQTEQAVAKTTQTKETTTQTTKTTEQFVLSTSKQIMTQFQRQQTTSKTTKVTEQYQLQTRQDYMQTLQTTKQVTQTTKVTEQFQQQTQQFQLAKTQFTRGRTHYTLEKRQTLKRVFQIIARDSFNETGTPVASCTPGGNITCLTNEIFAEAPVDPASCLSPSSSITAGPDFIQTTCRPGGATQAATPVRSCTPGTTMSAGLVVSTCTLVVDEAVNLVASCLPLGPTQSGTSPYITTTCAQPSGANNQSAFVESCAVGTDPASSGNGYVTTVCSMPTGANNQTTYVASCSGGTVAGTAANNWVTTTCSKPAATNKAEYAATCGNQTPASNNNYLSITCTPQIVSGPSVVDPATCVAGDSGNPDHKVTTCTSAGVGAYATATPVAVGTCVANNGSAAPFTVTQCSNPAGANNSTTFVASCTLGSTSSGTVQSMCTQPSGANNTSTPVASCSNVTPTSANNYVRTSCSTIADPPVIVAPASCPVGSTFDPGTGVVTTCENVPYGTPAAVATCTNSDGSVDGIITVCSSAGTSTPVASCVVGTQPGVAPDYIDTTCSKPAATNGSSYVASLSCTDQAPTAANGFVSITCTTATLSSDKPVATCMPGTGAGFVETSCSTVPAGPYTAWTPVASCAAGTGTGPDFFVTSCDQPAANNKTVGVPSCSVGTVAGTGPDYIKTTCAHADTTVFVSGSCSGQAANSSNGYKAITCTDISLTNAVPVASCNAGTGADSSHIKTQCNTVSVEDEKVVASCTPSAASAGNGYVATACRDTTPSTPMQVEDCVLGETIGDGPAFIHASCSTGAGSGFKRVFDTTAKVTDTDYSGETAVGAARPVSETTTATAQATDGQCRAVPLAAHDPNPEPVSSSYVSTPHAGGSSNSLADVAQYYYVTNLRPSPEWPAADWPTSGDGSVPSLRTGPEEDRAHWQHMTTFAVGLGVSGTLNYTPDYRGASSTGDFFDIRCASRAASDPSCKGWPVWPDPALSYTGVDGFGRSNTDNWNNAKSIDDFWHAAVNGRGEYFSAEDPGAVVSGLRSALTSITSRLAAGAAAGASSLSPTPGDNFAYVGSYVASDWTGDVTASEFNLTTGAVSATINWSAQQLLTRDKVQPDCDDRDIYLMRSGTLVGFTWNTKRCAGGTTVTELNGTEQAYFKLSAIDQKLSQYPSWGDGTNGTFDQVTPGSNGANLVNFLRGQRGMEGFDPNQANKPGRQNMLFRARLGVLGDIIGGQPVYVKAPFASYGDAGYKSFKAAKAGRDPMVYVAANDGMLHAFYAGTGPSDPNRGQERWAVIPSSVLPGLYKLADIEYSKDHRFFVDGTPTVGDAYDAGSSQWKTLLVGGLNKGGKAYYALDVTDPATPRALWEFTDTDLGYSFGKPVISKLANGTWVVMLTSGYNNVSPGNGQGYLYVLNAMTGAVISKIGTGAGSTSTPSGLAQINNFVDNATLNNTTLRVYGGDLLGNVWRFDVNAGIPAAVLVGTAKDSSSNPQPITVRPELAELGSKPIVFVATGRLLGSVDVSDTSSQSIYGIVDTLGAGPVYSDLRAALRPLAMTTVGAGAAATRTIACSSADTAVCQAAGGWVVDLPDAGERVNVNMQLVLGTLVVGSNVPQPSACKNDGYSWFNYFDFATGLAVTTTPDARVSEYDTSALIVGFNVIQLESGEFKAVVRSSDGEFKIKDPRIKKFMPPGKRISWREIVPQ